MRPIRRPPHKRRGSFKPGSPRTHRRSSGPPHMDRAMRRLRRANQLMEQGIFLPAADLYYKMARELEGRNHPRSPRLFLQAGRAWILAGNHRQGLGALRRGLQLMFELHPPQRGKAVLARVQADLRSFGMADEANQYMQEFAAQLEDLPESGPEEITPGFDPATALPLNCARCGAIIRPDEVEWVSNTKVICDYCGSAIAIE